jgi:hypothetical protein
VGPYRKATWAIEDTPQDLGLICRQMEMKGPEGIENVGPRLAQVTMLLGQYPGAAFRQRLSRRY